MTLKLMPLPASSSNGRRTTADIPLQKEVVIASDLTEAQKKKYRLYDNKTAEFASWDQRKLSTELCDVDFQVYDFGQPETALPDEEASGPKVMTCPCCGEAVSYTHRI